MTGAADLPADGLDEAQRAFLTEFSCSDLVASFVLSGGTALAAFHFHHRVSDDLDFFSQGAVDGPAVRGFLKGLAFLDRYAEQHLFDRNIFLLSLAKGGVLKVEFTRYPFDALDSPTLVGGVRVDSLRDIAANKIAAFADRADAKDAFDLFAFLERGVNFAAMVADAETKFGIAGLRFTLESRLLAVDRVVDWPKPLGAFSPEALVARFRDEARTLVRRDVAP